MQHLQVVRPCEMDFCERSVALPGARAPLPAATEPASGLVPSGNNRERLRPPGADADLASKTVRPFGTDAHRAATRSASCGDEEALGPAMTAMGAVTPTWSVFRPVGNNPPRSRSGTIGGHPLRLPVSCAHMSPTAPNVRQSHSSMPIDRPPPMGLAMRPRWLCHAPCRCIRRSTRRAARASTLVGSRTSNAGRTRPSDRIVRPEPTVQVCYTITYSFPCNGVVAAAHEGRK